MGTTTTAGGQTTFIRRAIVEDADTISSIVSSAYSKYIERMGLQPAPMLHDYREQIQSTGIDVYVLINDGAIHGSITLVNVPITRTMQVSNVVVDSSSQGRGFGRLLMDFAEAECRKRGFEAVTLYTNVKMHENIGLYLKLGFEETKRQVDGPYERVYFRKHLIPLPAQP